MGNGYDSLSWNQTDIGINKEMLSKLVRREEMYLSMKQLPLKLRLRIESRGNYFCSMIDAFVMLL